MVRIGNSDYLAEMTFEDVEFVKREQAYGSKRPPGSAAARRLSCSGGGDNGAFGAGLLAGWSARGARPEFKLVTGISTGALLAPFAFLGSHL